MGLFLSTDKYFNLLAKIIVFVRVRSAPLADPPLAHRRVLNHLDVCLKKKTHIKQTLSIPPVKQMIQTVNFWQTN